MDKLLKKVENTKNNEVGYYYYEVQNKTDKTQLKSLHHK